ncbi:PAS domain-containing protein [Gilvimarinus sp. F26214L]|uniref:PAS domain-containing protein n=1 Tax=Gilvimarinus sp. DZF01 TaxID=3461371 RepID=UPI004045F89C
MGKSRKAPGVQSSFPCEALMDAAPFMMAVLEGDDCVLRYVNRHLSAMVAHRDLLGRPLQDALPELRRLLPVLKRVREARGAGDLSPSPFRFSVDQSGQSNTADWSLDWVVQPLMSDDGVPLLGLYSQGISENAPANIGSLLAQDLRRMCQLSSNLLVVVGLDGRYRRISYSFTELLGWTEEEVLASPSSLFVHPDDRDHTRQETDRIKQIHGPQDFVNRLLHKDGSARWIAWTSTTVAEEGVIYAVGRDVSESRASDEALRHEARPNAFRIALSDAIRPLERSEDIQRIATRIIGEHFGVSRANFAIVHDEWAIVEEEYAKDAPSMLGCYRISAFGRIFNRDSASGRTLVVREIEKDPRLTAEEKSAYRDIQVTNLVVVPLIRRDRLAAVLSVSGPEPKEWSDQEVMLLEEAGDRIWNAMERADAEEAMRKSEELYRLISRATNDVIWDWDPESGRLKWNESLRSQLDLEPEDMPTLEDWYERVHPDDRARVRDSFRKAVENQHGTWSEEYRLKRKDGGYASLLDRGYLARDENGKLYRMIGAMLDLTERRQAEEALRTLNAQLVESDRRKDEFLAMLAHELRNPLAAIHNAVLLLGHTVQDPRSQRYLDILQRQSGHLSGLVDDLLDVSRVTRGLIMLKQERVNLAAVAGQALESVRILLENKGHVLDLQFPTEAVDVYGDPVRLEQILVNLLTNAAKYTDPEGQIQLRISASDGWAQVSVKDTGIGIAPEMQQRIFTLFGQAERGLDRAQGGLGIGLTIAKTLVELHGGTIEAHSAGLGKGAEFIVRLPLAERVDAGPKETVESPRTDQSRKRILVVEDHPDVAETLGLLLTEAGHRVTAADTGPAALEKADSFEPDIVLLDIGLPGMDGYEVARRMRENPHTRGAVIAALTGYGQSSDREQARAAGFNAHFVKPVNFRALSAFINSAH